LRAGKGEQKQRKNKMQQVEKLKNGCIKFSEWIIPEGV
jgi:hypothetical protein